MSFMDDVNATPNLKGTLRPGLQALSAANKAHVNLESETKLLGSVDVDTALKKTHPQAARWDYVVGKKQGESAHLHWIEVHPASSTGNIAEIEAKLVWLTGWMRGTPLLNYPRNVVWVASGKSVFNSRHPKLKALAARGLSFAGGHLTI